MDKEKNNLGFSHILLQGLTIWLMGGIIFWLTELLPILIGLSFDQIFLRNAMSFLEAISATLLLDKISMAFLMYFLTSFLGGLICTCIIYYIFRKTEVKINALIISIFLVVSFFMFSSFWLNIKYLSGLSVFKMVLINSIHILVSVMLAYLCFELFIGRSYEAFTRTFVALAFGVDFLMFGELFLLRSFSVRMISVREIALSIGLIMVSFSLFHVVKLTFTLKPFNKFSLFTVRKWVFLTALILILFSGLTVIVKEGLVNDAFRKEKKSSHNKPNIVLIVMDATRPDHLSCYGYERNTSPYIDKIAKEGVVFKNVISPSTWTVPSHASIFTGLFPFEHRAGHVSPYLPEKVETLTEILKKEGYQTLAYSNNPWMSFFNEGHRKFDDFQEGWREQRERYFYEVIYSELIKLVRRNDPTWLIKDKGAAKTNQYVSRWIGNNLEFPFFVFINYMETHFPHYPSPRNSIYIPENIAPGEINRVLRSAIGMGKGGAFLTKRERSQEELSLINALYDGEIHYLDKRIGELYEHLRKLNILDDTLLIITSDHGENLGDHGILGHAFGLFNNLLHVPLIIRYPKYFKPGLIIENNVQTIDIFYTILDAVSINYNPSNLGLGKSLIKRIKGHEYAEMMLAEHDKPTDALGQAEKFGIDANHINKDQRAIIFRGYKYIQTSRGEEELYDLKTDPNESHNLISEKREIAAALKSRLGEIYKTDRARAAGVKKIQMDKETESKLRSLGYLK